MLTSANLPIIFHHITQPLHQILCSRIRIAYQRLGDPSSILVNMTSETKEAKILREMRLILTEIARETAVRRGSQHILSIETIARMRDCLGLISDREKELNEALGVEMNSRPKLGEDKPNTVRVKLREIK